MSRIFLSKADIGELEEAYVLRAMQSGWVTSLGPDVDAFEQEVAHRVGVAGALALSSGTAALHLALLSLGAGPGTVVLLPTVTFVASANAVAYTGAEPVFVDCLVDDGNLDCDLLKDAVHALRNEGASIAAVMTVDLLGRCIDYEEIVDFLSAQEIPLLEDSAEAFGATYAGAQAGSFGTAAVLSFNGNKIMTTSGGGMLLSNDLGLLERCRHLATQAREPVPYYQHVEIGYNYRMSNILAAMGRAQLTRLPEMMSKRRIIRDRYAAGLGDVTGLRMLAHGGVRDDSSDNCWLTSIVLDPSEVTLSADSLIKALDADDIEARHLWKPMHLQPVFSHSRTFDTGSAEELFNTCVTLPSGSALTDDDIGRVVSGVRSALGCS